LKTAAIVFLLVALGCVFIRWSNVALQITRLEPKFENLPDSFDGYRIVVLSDLHGTEFGEEHTKLLAAVAAQQPDIIAVVGDLIDEDTPDPLEYAAELAPCLQDIAPVYYVTGNHEWAVGNVPALKKTLSNAGWTVLTNRFVPLERNGATIVLAGIDDPNGYADQKSPEAVTTELHAEWGDPFWLLLAHRNNRFENRYSLLGADLTISGHGHGGIIRLPFTDGLLSTERTLFPSYTDGFYEANGATVFVSRGIGNSGRLLRLFNPPQIAVITLRCGEG